MLFFFCHLGVVLPHLPCEFSEVRFWQFQWFAHIRPLTLFVTLILLPKYRDTNGRCIVMELGCVSRTVGQKEGILVQNDGNGGISQHF